MSIREGANVGRPPLLENENFGYWKAKMRAFIRAQDEMAWAAITTEWKPPTETSTEGVVSIKKESAWTEPEKRAALGNARALNAIFSAVDSDNFRLISNCESAYSAWEALQVAYEGTSKVKISRLQMITSKFESLRMKDDETITEFNAKLKDIANESAMLGEVMKDEKLVRKVLRSLPPKYDMKVTAIEEAQDVTNMSLQELMGSLRTYEMNLIDKAPTKGKTALGLTAGALEDSPDEIDEGDDLAMFARRFNRFFKSYKRQGGPSNNRNQFRGKRGNDREQTRISKNRFSAENARGSVTFKRSVLTL